VQNTINETTATTATTVTLKLANYASRNDCSLLADAQGYLCLLKRFVDEDGRRAVRLAPSERAYRPESEWLAAIAAGNAGRMIA